MERGSTSEQERLSASAWTLVRRTAGGASDIAGKAARLGRILRGYASSSRLDERLARLHAAGVLDTIPSRLQIAVGAWDMLRFWISPAAADYYREKQISYAFHQLLRFLDEPASLADPVGFFSERDGIIGHLMQVVHANPVYDLELLEMFPDGLDALEAQLESMLEGTHPRAASIGAIVEEADYHERLLDFVRRFRADPTIPPLLRSNLKSGASAAAFSDVERTFGSLRAASRYFNKMPNRWKDAVAYVRTTHRFRSELAEAAN